MFSLLSLYFAYRRDVLLAERYAAGLGQVEMAPTPVAAVTPRQVEELPLAA